MRICFCLAYVGLAAGIVSAQIDKAAKANALYSRGKRVDALPLYEELAKTHPKDMQYAERLADCLGAKAAQVTDPVRAKALRTRERDAAKRAIALGDKAPFLQLMATIDPNSSGAIAPKSPGGSLIQEGEKAFTAGDFPTALAKYSAAAEADPKLYEAPLYAGDTAYSLKDLNAAAKWFARAIAIDPNRATAYLYWGDAIMRYGNDPAAAKEKFIDAVVAEPYSKLSWQGIEQWAHSQNGWVQAPKIDRPAAPEVDSTNPKTINLNIDPEKTDEKKHPGASAWVMYSATRGSYHGEFFKKNLPDEKEYRHSLKEEDAALSLVAATVKARKIKAEDLEDSLRNLLALTDRGMLDCWILISGADSGIQKDYAAYRKEHRRLLHDYLAQAVVHVGTTPAK